MVDNEETRREGRNEEKKNVMGIQGDIGYIYEERDRREIEENIRIEGDWKTLLYLTSILIYLTLSYLHQFP